MNGNSLIEQLLNALSITGEGMRIASGIVLSLGIILILGFLMTRLTKLLKLPNVIAYLLVGILIGPSLINLIPSEFISRTSFISDVALVFVAFTAGEFFKFDVIKKSLGRAIVITAIESVVTFGLIFALCFLVFNLGAPFSLVLASLASATAPTSTIMTIKQTGAKGHYVTTLLEVLAIDGVFALILYTISISVFVGVADGSTLSFMDIGWPLLKMVICLAIGVAFGFGLKFLISSKRTTGNRLIIVVAALLLFCGVCSLFGQSPGGGLRGALPCGMGHARGFRREAGRPARHDSPAAHLGQRPGVPSPPALHRPRRRTGAGGRQVEESPTSEGRRQGAVLVPREGPWRDVQGQVHGGAFRRVGHPG